MTISPTASLLWAAIKGQLRTDNNSNSIKMFTVTVTFLVLSIATFAHGDPLRTPTLDGRIVGGEVVLIKNYPFQVALFMGTSYRCGGVIANKRWAITAAHCLVGAADQFSFRVGSDHRDRGGEVYQIVSYAWHPDYSRVTLDYDAAVMRTNEDIKFGVGIAPAAYHGQHEKVATGELLRVTGYGSTRVPSDDPTLLRAVSVPKVDQELCKPKFDNIFLNITDNMLCAGFTEGGRDACSGDSGGPLINGDQVLVGLVSWGVGCAEPNFPGVYARVASISDWITSQIKNL